MAIGVRKFVPLLFFLLSISFAAITNLVTLTDISKG